MKVIIAGSRNIVDYEVVKEAIEESQFTIKKVVSGGAKGVDALGERYADEMNIPLVIFFADWNTHGRSAGPIRNKKMAENPCATRIFSRFPIKNHPTGLYQILWDEVAQRVGFEPTWTCIQTDFESAPL